MGAHLITGYAGKEHITARDQGAYNSGIIGKSKYVLETGNQFKYEIVSSNLIKIRDGDLVNQGRHMNIAVNDYAEVQIDNGIQALKRNDLIVMRYSKNVETDIEKAEIVLIKGVSGNVATDPACLSGNILAGAATDDFPLYRVRLNGLNIEGVDRLFSTVKSLTDTYAEFNKRVGALSGLTTVVKTSIVNALNSVVSSLNSHNHDSRYFTEAECNSLFLRKANISSSNAITAAGTYALDAREKNAVVAGTLANQITNLGKQIPVEVNKGVDYAIADARGYTEEALEQFLRVEEVSAGLVPLAPNGMQTVNIPVNVGSYKILGILGICIEGTGESNCRIYKERRSSNQVFITIKNTHTSVEAKISVKVGVLMAKSAIGV